MDAQASAPAGFETLPDTAPPGLIRRFLVTLRNLAGMLFGGWVAAIRARRDDPTLPRPPLFLLQRMFTGLARLFLNRRIVAMPFPVQFRRRLEMMGPTYIKLGQILCLRTDLLPEPITSELKNLLDRLPVVTFDRYVKRIEDDLGRPVDRMFSEIDPLPLGSASIAQIHRATTVGGDSVILKVVKPGIRQTLERDAILLKMFGTFLQTFLGRYQPRRIISEFCDYTLKEADLRREADNAETFQANFRDMPDVVFPKIYREYSGRNVLCMEFLDGFKPSDPRAARLTEKERDRLVDLGAASIIRMVYRDGFFHADLHSANLLILEGTRCGFIDLGMVGRFDQALRRTLLYYYYCLVIGDSENAARFLAAVAEPGRGADPTGFRKEVEEISRRWSHHATFEDFSLAQLILESLGKAGQYRMYFPVELVLMVKALVTFEGVGNLLRKGFDVADVSRRHISRIFFGQFNPVRIAKDGLRGAPEVVDALVKSPMLVTEGLRFLEQATRQPMENPLSGIRGTLFAGFCLLSGAILVAFNGPWPLWAALFGLAFLLILRRGH